MSPHFMNLMTFVPDDDDDVEEDEAEDEEPPAGRSEMTTGA